jgi:hypothetical protein
MKLQSGPQVADPWSKAWVLAARKNVYITIKTPQKVTGDHLEDEGDRGVIKIGNEIGCDVNWIELAEVRVRCVLFCYQRVKRGLGRWKKMELLDGDHHDSCSSRSVYWVFN